MDIKSLIKNSSIYGIILLLQKGINFILIPILTAYLTPDDYGIISVVTTINAFLNVFYLFGFHGSLNRFYYEYKHDDAKTKRLFGTVITFVIVNSTILTSILLLSKEFSIEPFLGKIEFYPYMLLGLISVLFNPIFTIFQNSLQAKQNATDYGKNNMYFFIINLSLLIVGVVLLNLGAIGVIGALAITNFVFFLYSIFKYKNSFSLGIDLEILKKIINYSLPILPHTLSGVATNLIDRLLINKLLSTSLVGIYSIGNNFGTIVFIVAQGINQAFVPWFNEKVKSNNVSDLAITSKFLVLIYCITALGLSFFGKEVIMFITPESYHASWVVIPFIAFAFVFHGVYYFYAGVLFYDIKGRGNRLIPFSTVGAALMNIILNMLLIPKYGIIGAGLATLVSKFSLSLSLKFYYNKYLDIKYPEKFLLCIPLLFFGVSLITFYLETSLLSFIIKLSIFLIVVLLVIIYFKKERITLPFKLPK